MTRGQSPDAILLQQLNLSAARWLRRAFSRATGHRYRIVASPDKQVRNGSSGGLIVRNDTAILVNSSAVRVESHGVFKVRQDHSAARGTPIEQVVPWASLIERGDGVDQLRLATTSIHFPTHRAFRSRSESHQHKAHWSARLHRLLGKEIRTHDGPRSLPVLAGDFNARRCRKPTSDRSGDCRPSPFWNTLTELGYRESYFLGEYAQKEAGIIDFIFTKANVSDVRWDYEYKPTDKSRYYSDHRVGAALLEDEDTTPPYPPRRPRLKRTPGGHPRLCEWAGQRIGWDGGSGLKEWIVYRREVGVTPWEIVAKVKEARYDDPEVDFNGDDVYEYRIAAADRAGNISRPSATRQVPRKQDS